MTPKIEALFNDALIAAAARTPRGPTPTHADFHVHRDNPFCGDEVSIDLVLGEDGRIATATVRARGCLLVEAAATVLAEAAPGLHPCDIAEAARHLRAMLKKNTPPPGAPWATLEMFSAISSTPSRHSCALLPFEAVEKALGGPLVQSSLCKK
ncbi:iron-sulfur cluster assembly scaffold protein [Rhodospirillum rubrum]|uniref:MifU-like protein, Fe-S cluster formation n=1 Tax=Rhodospirillum rubrum (strain ATCC 11170 / ATH 1.1.1 / DSM 467 / LMG 4362 / NCIMB 8255 / S1) TaxID=269796 RepID=Q2RVT1_RHORT|nr:iron-sulfur cluster assembly scaffold protein [Rhodospirillum rubrum]ABC21764.1 MifU-like protein, Fe-S cluster formation [Rhodospirillum rubrum ATCC 11170]AEO47462.1 MifU-like protein, Fe-S cluster formation [Rhodospirillum rubrum F11]MBK5953321.1 iron-sulfur cluster scaffold-like protein [Rhodospirillum rubrum]QXG81426.1 iron-sulfur cluster assembly scaffold protein [Rhodospirillum rubrum]HAP98996.1 iron-sulfur cluster assembly scaffold protein [Rhodospirillum rubrum]